MTGSETRAKPEPLFHKDLGANGGHLAPTTVEELIKWVAREREAWDWLYALASMHPHDAPMREGLGHLNDFLHRLNQLKDLQTHSGDQFAQQLGAISRDIEAIYTNQTLRHSTTPEFKRIDKIRQQSGDAVVASFFAGVIAPAPQQQLPQPNSIAAWQGFYLGLQDRFGTRLSDSDRMESQDATFQAIRDRADKLVTDKGQELEEVHRAWENFHASAEENSKNRAEAFSRAQIERADAFDKLRKEHEDRIANIQKAFREGMELRAPADYWKDKSVQHRKTSNTWGVVAFLVMAVSCVVLVFGLQHFLNLPDKTPPATWQIAGFALVGLFAVWATRLLVRVWLSERHLATDADERVMIVKTYLSLAEAGLPAEEAVRLQLFQALFRPASDGIVKDEGVPPSFVEALTRPQRN